MHIKIGVSKAPITEAPESRRTFWGTVSISRQALLRFFMFFSLSLLVSRVTIAGQLMPFGAAFIAAAYLNRKSAGWLAVFLGSLASAFVLWKDASLPHIALYAILYALLCLTALVRIKRHLITAVTAALLAYAITIAVFNRGLIYDSLMWVFETGISVVMVFVFNIAFGLKPGSRRLRTVLMDDEIISAAFVCLVVVLGFSDISFLGVYLRNIASVFLALLFAYTGGLAVGAAVGVMLGFGVMLAGGDVAFMANLAMGALVAGLLNKTNRVACAVGFLIINAIMTFFINNSAVVIIPLVDSLAAIGIFLCLPRKFLETAGTFVDANLSRLHAQKISIRRFRELTVGRLHEVAGIFANAAAVFERSERRPSDCTLAVRGVRERVCRDCPIANYCWQNGKAADEEFRRAYCEYGRSGYCELSGAFGKK